MAEAAVGSPRVQVEDEQLRKRHPPGGTQAAAVEEERVVGAFADTRSRLSAVRAAWSSDSAMRGEQPPTLW